LGFLLEEIAARQRRGTRGVRSLELPGVTLVANSRSDKCGQYRQQKQLSMFIGWSYCHSLNSEEVFFADRCVSLATFAVFLRLNRKGTQRLRKERKESHESTIDSQNILS
jgi:hypothetical protein